MAPSLQLFPAAELGFCCCQKVRLPLFHLQVLSLAIPVTLHTYFAFHILVFLPAHVSSKELCWRSKQMCFHKEMKQSLSCREESFLPLSSSDQPQPPLNRAQLILKGEGPTASVLVFVHFMNIWSFHIMVLCFCSTLINQAAVWQKDPKR